MISYAQNREDVLLNRLFRGKNSGFYIDVGASHPELFSVTKYFYDKGWNGINIDPISKNIALFNEQRPRDINLCLALGQRYEVKRLTVIPDPHGAFGLSTINDEVANQSFQKDRKISSTMVQVHTLADICLLYTSPSPRD